MFELFFFGILAGALYATWHWWPTSLWVIGPMVLYIIISDEIQWWRVDRRKARTAEERRRSYLGFWAARMGMLGTANKLLRLHPIPSEKELWWERVNLVIWLAIFAGAIFSVAARFPGADPEEKHDTGYEDGYAVGYNTTCEIRGTMIEGDWESSDYRSGYEAGYSDGAQECLMSRR